MNITTRTSHISQWPCKVTCRNVIGKKGFSDFTVTFHS